MSRSGSRHAQIADLVAKGQQLLQKGDLAQAELAFQHVLQLAPRNVDALHLLGVIAHRSGKLSTAADFISKAIDLNRSIPNFHLNLGNVFKDQGKLDEAVICYQRALQLNPNYAKALNNIGVILRDQGKLDQAITQFHNALNIDANYAEALLNIGATFQLQGNLESAANSFLRALQLKPDDALTFFSLGNIFTLQNKPNDAATCFLQSLRLNPSHAPSYFNIANSLNELGKQDEAINFYREAIKLEPNFVEAYNNLGNIFMAQEKLEDAVACYRQALQLTPDSVNTLNNLGTALRNQGRLDEALAQYHRALDLQPGNEETLFNLGGAFKAKEELDSALKYYQEAIHFKPDYALAHQNLSTTLLQVGNLTQGWQEYEWRWNTPDGVILKRPFPQPWWQGEDLSDKTILVWAEQGVGDEIIFASMLPDIIARAGHCIVECDARLVPLFARSFPNAEVVPRSNPPHLRTIQPDVHFQIPMGSLARWFRNGLDRFPAHCGYLAPDPQQVTNWKNRLAGLGSGRKVGICWRSMWRSVERNAYFTVLDQWGPILSAHGLVFVNLQYDRCQPELDAAEQQFGVKIHAWDDIDLKNDLDDAAALTAALDLVISAPTSVAAMAGSLGVPVWELAGKEDNWSTLGTDHMPWHPSIRLFMRAWNGNWDGVIEEISRELRGLS